jgi:hypothetical protein
VSIERQNSVLFDLILGTVQGSILGPVLYSLFVSPLLDFEFKLPFADDKYVFKMSCVLAQLILDMEKSLHP